MTLAPSHAVTRAIRAIAPATAAEDTTAIQVTVPLRSGGYPSSRLYHALRCANAPATAAASTTSRKPASLFGPETRPRAPADGLPALSGRTKRFASIIRRVQLALLAQDLYSGAIDGVVGPALRSALRKFQKARQLDITGTITRRLWML